MQAGLWRPNKSFWTSWVRSPREAGSGLPHLSKPRPIRLHEFEHIAAGFAFSVEPPAAGRDISKGANPGGAVMAQWNDTMVDRPESDSAIYATGWSISGLAVLGIIFAVWIFGI
jgi:hypothetical protein